MANCLSNYRAVLKLRINKGLNGTGCCAVPCCTMKCACKQKVTFDLSSPGNVGWISPSHLDPSESHPNQQILPFS